MQTKRLEDSVDLKIDKKSSFLLFCTIIVFVTAFAFLSYLRYMDFFTSNWDFGIFQQMFWSTTHGRLLYEAGDYISYGVHSFLEIHSGYVAVGLSYIYLVYPSPVTIFVFQTVFVSLSIIPLYKIMLYYGVDRKYSYLYLLPVLLNFVLISATFYDFHLESLIPLEFLTMYYYAMRKRYFLMSMVFVTGCLTLEVFPFLAAGLGLYLLLERTVFSKHIDAKGGISKIIPAVLILLASGFAYIIIRMMQYNVIPVLVGDTAVMSIHGNTVSASILSVFDITATPFSIAMSSVYWLMLLASLAFIPFLSPRHLILAVPWLIASVLLFPQFSNYFGNQYGYIAISPLLVGYAHGLRKILNGSSRRKLTNFRILSAFFIPLTAVSLVPGFSAKMLGYGNIGEFTATLFIAVPVIGVVFLLRNKIPGVNQISLCLIKKGTRRLAGKAKWIPVIFLVLLILFNINLSPLNTANFEATPYPGYQFSYAHSPMSEKVTIVAQSIPYNVTIVASDNLFPYVANRLNSFALLWFPPPNGEYTDFFPFNSSHLPEYLLISSSQLQDVPHFLYRAINDTSLYGLVYNLYSSSYPGSVYLYREGYTGEVHYVSS